MANAYGSMNKQYSTPYLTVAEYKQAPTAIDYSNLVVGSSDPLVQNAELANVIARASSYMDNICNQVLEATEEEEQQRCRLGSDGMLAIHPSYGPIIAVTELKIGTSPTNLVTVNDPSLGWVENYSYIFPYTAAYQQYSSQGSLAFGLPSRARSVVYCHYTYVAGFFNDILAANSLATASSITITEPTGLTVGTKLTIYDGANTESVTVASTYTYGSTTVPLVSPTLYAHTAGVSASALPPSIKQAAILVTTAFLKVRGDNALVMDLSTSPSSTTGVGKNISDEISMATEILKPFRRIR